MKTIDLNSWTDFAPTLKKIQDEFGTYEIMGHVEKNKILYRGQADFNWKLQTTLERFDKKSWSISRYAQLLKICSIELESFTDHNYALPSMKALNEKLRSKFDSIDFQIPFDNFWIYMRHHDFPSPLLDWTYSPYIAAYFALAEKNSAEKASIYAYIETPKGIKACWEGSLRISVLGPHVKTHKRHFLQQAWYTIATKVDNDRKEHDFGCHEDVFLKNGDKKQDVLIKINIPRSNRLQILEQLASYNINHFSLFQSEESLIRTMAFKEIELKGLA